MPITYSKKVKGLDLTDYNEIEIYELVLNGTIGRFPPDFWNCDEVNSYAPQITRYLIEEKLKWTKEDIKKKLFVNTFKENKLAGLINIVYNGSYYQAISHAYGEDYIKPWEFNSTPMKYWQGKDGVENGIKATKWMIEEKLKWNENDIRNKLCRQIFMDCGLNGMLTNCFNGAIYQCINNVYPNKFMPWEIGLQVPNNFWNEETSRDAMTWLIDKKLKWNLDDIKDKLNAETFVEYNLRGLLQYFNSSPFQAINSIYPNVFKPWEIGAHVSNNYWNEETSRDAMKWLILDKLKWSLDDIKNNLDGDTFINNGLSGLFHYFNDSPYQAINFIYPNTIKPWELKSTPRGFWNKDTAKEVINWFIYEKLNWSKEYAKENLSKKILSENRLGTLANYYTMQEIKDLID